MQIQEDFPIKKDSIVKTEVQGLSGQLTLNITKGVGENFESDEKAIIYLDLGLLAKLNAEATTITEGINESINRVNTLLSKENLDTISSILTSTDNILKSFDDNKTELNELITNLNDLVKSIDKFAQTSAQTSAKFSNTLTMVNEGIARGDYNVKEILGPTLHESSLTLIEFKKSLREFQRAMFRLEDDPYDFFFRDTGRGDRR